MARCAGLGATIGYTSGSCASRSLGLRVAPLSQVVESQHLEVARRAVLVGATRQYKIQS
ncbi:hypothetical protein A2U01_0095978 [Trifolium medium]|uniref:Uncharacterized protein n=1 Tax=Trifolium medium TaxID=97028 RepID=A0A392UPZ5_9FABA|nr:hypothetical protein [Trifolium medium]